MVEVAPKEYDSRLCDLICDAADQLLKDHSFGKDTTSAPALAEAPSNGIAIGLASSRAAGLFICSRDNFNLSFVRTATARQEVSTNAESACIHPGFVSSEQNVARSDVISLTCSCSRLCRAAPQHAVNCEHIASLASSVQNALVSAARRIIIEYFALLPSTKSRTLSRTQPETTQTCAPVI
jgi:hypothetical protein